MSLDRSYCSAHQVVVQAEREAVFGYLADLSNHWQLLGKTVESFEPRMNGRGAVLHMRAAPLPVRRRVETEIVAIEEPSQIRGCARSRKTTASISWRLDPAGQEATRVTLTVSACPVGLFDTMIVRLGGAWWRNRYRAALKKLSAEFGDQGTPEDCAVPVELGTGELADRAPA